MTKKDFQLIADVLKTSHCTNDKPGDCPECNIAFLFAKELAKTNQRFNKHKFLTACGVANEVKSNKN